MQKPKCKECLTRHWPREPHQWPDEFRTAEEISAAREFFADVDKSAHTLIAPSSPERLRDDVTVLAETETVVVTTRLEKLPKQPKFDRNAYQREYMRKRRREARKNP